MKSWTLRSKWSAGRTPCGGAAQGAVRFDRVAFAYHAGEPVLEAISFQVQPGQCVGIVGETGAGKSTLLSLIARFYDVAEGAVSVDGVDVRQWHLDDLRRNMGIVFQESFLFSNTVAANIAFGQPDADAAAIERAARVAAAHDFIRRCRRVTRRSSASTGRTCRAASGSGWPLPGLCCSIRRS